ncbi:MAG: molybdopterin molybdotransferase MoeA [Alphaproteobacteria bacterium]
MLSFNDALAIARNLGRQMTPVAEQVDVSDAVGRISACSLDAPIHLPPFDNSAMDGFAVRQADLEAATPQSPVMLHYAGQIAAGDVPDLMLKPGQCIEIMTGAPMPQGADAVVPVELTGREQDTVSFNKPAAPRQHIRSAGSDISKGQTILNPGERLHQGHILPLSSLGISHVEVWRAPRIALIITGSELVDDAAQPLKPGQIYNSNLAHAASWLDATGCMVIFTHTAADTTDALLSALTQAQQAGADAIICTGGVSMGRYDLVPEAVSTTGATTLFHRIRMRPGMPQLLARLPDGTPLFGLPGNPISAACGLRFLVESWRRAFLRLPVEAPITARLTHDMQGKRGFTFFAKARHQVDETGQMQVTALDGQLSYMTHPMARMTCWLHVPDSSELTEGDLVQLYPVLPA